MATIYDVAKQAGVSPKTVSRVINCEPNVRAATRAVVETAIGRLDYRPNTVARLMKSQRSHVLGFLTDQVVTSPEAIDIAKGVATAAQSHGQTVLFVPSNDQSLPFQSLGYTSLIDLNVDGLIYASHMFKQIETDGIERRVPTVLVNCFDKAGTNTSVIPDDEFGGFEAGRTLIEAGHRRVAMLNLDEAAIASKTRSAGFLRAFAQADLPKPQIVTALGELAGSWDEHKDLPQILDQVLAHNPTALFCGNDKMAMVTYGLLAERGLRVAEDISVIGFDDYQLITRLLRPQLSSVSIAYDEIGQRAVKELLALVETGPHPSAPPAEPMARQIKVAGGRQLRQSVAKIT